MPSVRLAIRVGCSRFIVAKFDFSCSENEYESLSISRPHESRVHIGGTAGCYRDHRYLGESDAASD